MATFAVHLGRTCDGALESFESTGRLVVDFNAVKEVEGKGQPETGHIVNVRFTTF